jgi:hypothetical protein
MVLVAGMHWSDAMQGRRERSQRSCGRDRGRRGAPIQCTICDIATISLEPPR